MQFNICALEGSLSTRQFYSPHWPNILLDIPLNKLNERMEEIKKLIDENTAGMIAVFSIDGAVSNFYQCTLCAVEELIRKKPWTCWRTAALLAP